MALIIVLVLGVLFLGIWSSKMDHLSKTMLYIYLSVWGIALVLSVINLFNINAVSGRTYSILLIHIVAFVIGFSLLKVSNLYSHSVNPVVIESQVNRLIGNKFFRTVLFIFTLYVLSLITVYYRQVIIYNNLAEIRSGFFYEENLYGEHFRVINQWLLKPFSIFVTPLFAFLCCYRRDKICLLLGIFLFLYNSLSAGRFGYIKIALGFVFVIFCLFPHLKKKTSNWLVILLIFSGVFLLVLMTTVARLDSFSSFTSMTETGREIFGENVVIGVTQPINSLDYSIEKNYVDRVGGYQYGGLTFTSIQKVFNPFLRKIGAGIELSSSRLSFKQEEYIDIGYIRDQNALYTSSLWYYLDFGWFGIILFPILFGILIKMSVIRFYRYQTLASAFLIAYFFQLMVFSLFDYYITGEHDLFFLILMWVLSAIPLKRGQSLSNPIFVYLLLAMLYTFTQL